MSAGMPPTPQPVISTGVAGLDQLLQGGLTTERMYLVQGDPGTGKTTLAVQFLMEGRNRGESCLYVTLSETTRELRAVAISHGWSLEGIELFQLAAADAPAAQDEYTLYHPSEVELGETVKAMLAVVERARPSRVVFDSLSEMRLLARDPLRYRRQILALKEYFAGRACTVLLLDDNTADSGDLQLQSLSHGVILLDQVAVEYGRTRRRVRIVKYRGVPAAEGYHDFTIRRGGLVVFPQLTLMTPAAGTPTGEPLSSGVEELDQLLGGGFSWASTTLLIGPAGSGKSTLAGQYVTAAKEEARAAVFLFEERQATFVARCDTLGMGMSDRIAAGHITITQVAPGEMSPGEFSHRVCETVNATGSRVVMIDSANGYLNAIPQSDAPLVRLHELLSHLNSRGVATIIVIAQHGIIGTAMSTPIDLSYVADCVVLLRFFEAKGTVRKAISVVKKRTGTHESTIRELMIGPLAVRAGAALAQFQGVLTGVPTYVGHPDPLLKE
jgi:circadian clock protein KaiC